jgi:protease-4
MCTLVTFATTFLSRADDGFGGGDAIALIRVEGEITEGDAAGDLFATGAFSRTIVKQIRRASETASVKAILLRVNSPGGGIVASDDIYREVLRAKERGKKVVVSMGTLAASGGYYISAPADRIVASPGTLTGSIGVISMFPNATELMEDIGVDVTVIKSGQFKDEGSPFRPMTEAEISYFQSMIDQMYDQFVDIVSRGRNMDTEAVRRIADGRVYTGQTALELGLVDEMGDLDHAVAVAAGLAGLQGKPRVVEQRGPGFFELFFQSGPRGMFGLSPRRMLESEARPSFRYLYIQ